MKVTFFDAKPYDRLYFEPMLADAGIDVKFCEYRLSPETAALAAGSEAVCIFVNDDAGEETIDALARAGVKLVALRCSGYNNVDFGAAEGRVRVVRVPAYSPAAVAEYAAGLMLATNRKIPRAYARVRSGNFSINGFLGFDLEGRTAGVVGTGRIGKKFIAICRGFGMKIAAYDAYPDPSLDVEYLPLEELERRADVISLHCPLTDETRHMINSSAIERMKDGVILINTSRGGLIDTTALLDGLKSKKIGGAGLDVYEEEEAYFYEDLSNEVITDEELLQLLAMPNVILSSHQAFFTEDAMRAIAETTVGSLLAFRDGRELENELRFERGGELAFAGK